MLGTKRKGDKYVEKKGIQYTLTYKNVKNINLRVREDGSVHVSANPHVARKTIDTFVHSKAVFIEKAQKRLAERKPAPQTAWFSEEGVREKIASFCAAVYPYYERQGIPFPEIRFRKMVSRWGSCHREKGILTFNLHLMCAPPACVEYVVWHEFTHFLVPDHSANFYRELEIVCPDWKRLRKILKEIHIR